MGEQPGLGARIELTPGTATEHSTCRRACGLAREKRPSPQAKLDDLAAGGRARVFLIGCGEENCDGFCRSIQQAGRKSQDATQCSVERWKAKPGAAIMFLVSTNRTALVV